MVVRVVAICRFRCSGGTERLRRIINASAVARNRGLLLSRPVEMIELIHLTAGTDAVMEIIGCFNEASLIFDGLLLRN